MVNNNIYIITIIAILPNWTVEKERKKTNENEVYIVACIVQLDGIWS